jgi:chaperonin GroEL
MTPDEHAYLRLAIDALADAVIEHGANDVQPSPDLGDEWQRAAAQMVVQAANQVSRLTGDGAARTVLLTRRIHADLTDALALGYEGSALKRGLDKALKAIDERLSAQAERITAPADLARIAVQVGGGDAALARAIAQAVEGVGVDGPIVIGDPCADASVVDFATGCQFDREYLSPYFATDWVEQIAVLDRPLVMLADLEILVASDALRIVDLAARAARPVLVVATDVSGEALATLAARKLAGQAGLCAVKVPAFGARRKAVFEDLAVLTGARVVAESVAAATATDLGTVERAIVDWSSTTMIAGKGPSAAVAQRVAAIGQAVATTTSDYDKEQMQKRIAMLAGAAVLRPQAGRQGQADARQVAADCLKALREAHAGGVLAGGGRALADCAAALDDSLGADDTERRGIAIVRDAALELRERSPSAPAPADLARTVTLSLGLAAGTAWVLATDEAYLHRLAARERAA